MRTFFKVVATLVGLFTVLLSAGARDFRRVEAWPTANLGEETELRRLVRVWDDAMVKNDSVALEKLLADEFSFVDGPNKTQYLNALKQPPANSQVESAVSTDVEVQVFGDSAIVLGLDTIKGKNNGQPYEHVYRYMDVWIKRAGRWQCVKVYSNLLRRNDPKSTNGS